MSHPKGQRASAPTLRNLCTSVVILSMLVIFSMFNQGGAQPIEDLAPNHAGPKQVGSEHLGPSRNQHAGPAGGPQIGSVKPEDIVLY